MQIHDVAMYKRKGRRLLIYLYRIDNLSNVAHNDKTIYRNC